MAVHHPAKLVPGKLELLQAWVPQQPWLGGADATTLTTLGSYRFDDPDGEVGMETHLLRTADGQVLQVPLTYRGAPLPGADLITTMTHTTLGDRWIYDGCTDPVYRTALARTIATGGREADLFAATPDGLVQEQLTTHVRGSGSRGAPVPDLRGVEVIREGTATRVGPLTVFSVPVAFVPVDIAAESTLTGTWPGQDAPLVLAALDA